MQKPTSFADVKPRVDTGLRGRQIAGPDWKDMSPKRDAGSRSRSRSTASRMSLQNRRTTSVTSKTLVESPTSSKIDEYEDRPTERDIIHSRLMDLIDRQIKDKQPRVQPATSLESGKEYYTIHVICLSMDPVLLKRSLRTILKGLGLHGTILRHEVEQDAEQHFATFIAFEALVSKGKGFVAQIIKGVKQLDIVKPVSFSADYTQLTTYVSEYPIVNGVSIAETSSLFARQGSSGIKYDYVQVSKSHEVVDTVSSYVQKYITPAVGIVQQFTGTASASGATSEVINNLLTPFTPPRFKVRYHDSPWLFPVNLVGSISNMSTVILAGLGALDGIHPKDESVCNDWLVFDKHKLHLPTHEALERLPQGSELIFVPRHVARPSKGKDTL